MCGKGPRNLILKCQGPEFCSTTTNCSRTPLIAQWYLGGPLTNSRMIKWSMDDMSLSRPCWVIKPVPHIFVQRIRSWDILSSGAEFLYLYWKTSKIIFLSLAIRQWTQIMYWVGRHSRTLYRTILVLFRRGPGWFSQQFFSEFAPSKKIVSTFFSPVTTPPRSFPEQERTGVV